MNAGTQTWGLRVLALGIAIGLWFNFSFEAREAPSERLIEAAVSYNRPREYTVLDPVQSVNVRLRGSSKAIRRLSPSQVSVQVDLSRYQQGTWPVSLGAENVLVPENLEVVSIEPVVIRAELEKEVTQRLPVVPKLTGEPAGGATLEEPEVLPNQVLVTGPLSRITKAGTLSTQPISLDGHAIPFETQVAVVSPDPLIQIVQPFKVLVRVVLTPPQVETPPERQPHRGRGRHG
ncbi:MAG TPA: CdaR family protein [Thermoanaerobaculia bacterium]|nr:CdaR family protein [Thermoanaerobaculia bacterium]